LEISLHPAIYFLFSTFYSLEYPMQTGHVPEPDEDPRRPPEHNLGWRVVAAAILLPFGMLVTESLALTLIVAVFAATIIAKANDAIAAMIEQDPVFRWFDRLFQYVVLAIFVIALARNVLR
jgi:hypothetical protein